MDSDLEAFSHNPVDDSFAALAAQPTALPNIQTNGSSRTKLDYCRDNQLISRVKLTCLLYPECEQRIIIEVLSEASIASTEEQTDVG